MNFGFRYHVASLMAVFFSLILGILIGGALSVDHSIVDEQASLIAELEERFQELHASFALVQGELDRSNLAWSQLLDVISQDSLGQHTIVFVHDHEEDPASLHTLLLAAGADVKSIRPEHLDEITPNSDHVFVFPLAQGELPPAVAEAIDTLALAGANLSFIWGKQGGPDRSVLPPSLQVDNIDTAGGKAAFILGLATGSQGYFGSQGEAQRLLP
ncbi:MAG: copper transporter [Bacillota bacterium]|nr:copper transporter [Bacillota bacterium]HHT91405.1 copper transporter [Bacillota bacterium]